MRVVSTKNDLCQFFKKKLPARHRQFTKVYRQLRIADTLKVPVTPKFLIIQLHITQLQVL